MSFQKDRSCQCRLINPEGLSLGHRRLRFSFQINDFKDQDRKNRPNCLAPVRGGGGYLAAPVFRVKQFFLKNFLFTKPLREERRRRLSSEGRSPCQPGFSAFLRFPKPKLRRPQQTAGKTERHPSTQSSDSIEARNLTEPTDQSKKLFQTPAPTKTPKTQSPKPRWASPSPSEAAIYVRLFGVARTFSQKVQKSQRTRVAGTAAAAPRAYTRGLVCEIGSGEAAKFSPLKMKSVRDFIAERPGYARCGVLSSTFLAQAVAPQHWSRHKSASSKGLFLVPPRRHRCDPEPRASGGRSARAVTGRTPSLGNSYSA